MGYNWIECLLEEYPELYDILDCCKLDLRVILDKKILDFESVKETSVKDNMLCIDGYMVSPVSSVRKIVTQHKFNSLDTFCESLLLHSTSRLAHDMEYFYVECTYEPSMQLRGVSNA